MKTKEAVDQAFDYGKKLGVNLLICAPNYELLPYVEQKVKETNIRVAESIGYLKGIIACTK